MVPASEEGQEDYSEDEASRGDSYELSGDFRGAVINIKSTIVGAEEAVNIEEVPPEPGEPPFQGLQYFGEADAGRFFGREQLPARLIGRLHRTSFLAVIGASGSGKSSLVRAGVIPSLRAGERLADGALPPKDSGNWGIKIFTPGSRPIESLASTILFDAESLTAGSNLSDELLDSPQNFPLAVRQFLASHSKSHLLLVIDQFEELFTQSRRPDEVNAFIECITAGAQPDVSLPLTVVIILRADYYAQVAQLDTLRELVSQHQEFIGAMNRDELIRAIDQPLALGSWQIQEGLIEVILDDVGYEPGALPLLSHALLETWKRRRGRTLTLSGYREAGGVRGAIAETAENVFRKQLTPEQQPIARMIFMRLTEVGEESSDTRRRATFSELITRSTDEVTINTVLGILSDSRLVITDTLNPGSITVVEVSHEAIIREWPTMQRWLAEDREGLLVHQALSDDAEDWDRLGRDPGILYRGTRLESAEAWADDHPDQLNTLEADFLSESRMAAREEALRAERLARATRNQRIILGVVGILIVVIGYLFYSNFISQEAARMDGFFNIAVAEIEGNRGAELTDEIYGLLQDSIGEDPNLLLWHDGPELTGLNVEVGPVGAAAAEGGGETAEEKAQRLGADMVIFGRVDSTSIPETLSLEYYLTPQQDYQFDDLQGSYALDPIDVNDIVAGSTGTVSSLAWTALGLTEAQLGHSVEALEAFLKADGASPGSETTKFFIGREYLFLVDRESVLSAGREAFEANAEEAFQEAIRINDAFSRAHIGIGSVYFKQARGLLADSLSVGDPAPLLDRAINLSEQAADAYQRAIDTADGENSGIPLEAVASLGLGNVLRLRADIFIQQGDLTAAQQTLDESIMLLEGSLPPLERDGQIRFLTQGYEYLGGAYFSQGYVLENSQDFIGGLEAYESALEYYELCIDQSDISRDVIINQEIIEQICLPQKQAVEEIIENFSGGQG